METLKAKDMMTVALAVGIETRFWINRVVYAKTDGPDQLASGSLERVRYNLLRVKAPLIRRPVTISPTLSYSVVS